MNLEQLIKTLNKAHKDNSTGILSDIGLKDLIKELKRLGPKLGTIEFNKLNKGIKSKYPCQRIKLFFEKPNNKDQMEAEKLEDEAEQQLRNKKLKENGGKRLDTEFSRKEKQTKGGKQ